MTTVAPTTAASEYYETCFSEYALGTPADWTEYWNTGDFDLDIESGGNIGSNVFKLNQITGNSRTAAGWDDIGSVVDVEILCKIKWAAKFSLQMGPAVRISGNVNENGYVVFIDDDNNDIELRKYVNGSVTSGLAFHSHTVSIGNYYWLRFRSSDDNFKVKIWDDGGTEPVTWDIDYTDPSPYLTSGAVGFGNYYVDGWCDWFSAATNGGTALSPGDITGCTTVPPTTIGPTTVAPTSLAPTTIVTTGIPTTVVPTTLSPTTVLLTSLAPTTVVPTTVLPTTLGPTTTPPTFAPSTDPPPYKGGYSMVRNGSCIDGTGRCKWASLGRTGASQGSSAIDERGRLFTWGQNNDGQCGQGNSYLDDKLDEIEYATQLGSAENWVKVCAGEIAQMAINDKGELWGWGRGEGDTGAYPNSNCANFGLPENGGVNWNETGPGAYAFRPILCTPGYLWKDFAFDYYHGMGIDFNGKLWVWGNNYDWAFGMKDSPVVDYDSSYLPIQHTVITEDVKIVDCEILTSVVVTVSNKVYIMGDWYSWYPASYYADPLQNGYPWEVPGLVISDGETIIDASISYEGCYVLLSDGTTWACGEEYYAFGAVGGVYHGQDEYEFIQVPFLIGKNIVKIRYTGLGGGGAACVIDSDGNIWGMCEDPWYPGTGIDQDIWLEWSLIGAKVPGEKKWIDVIFNQHNTVNQAIDSDGYLYTWGSQYWGTHLAIGAANTQSDYDDDPSLIGVVRYRYQAGKAAMALDYSGEFTTLNAIPLGESEYDQGLDQDKRHRPCGHWHLRKFVEDGGAAGPSLAEAQNCWMPSVAIHDGVLLFIAAGKHLNMYPDTGADVIMLLYDIDAGEWTTIVWEELKQAANAPGGAAIDVDIYAFFNWKLDGSGDRWNEIFTNPGVGIWVYDGTTETLNYTEWNDSENYAYGRSKMGVHAGGLVALAYKNNSSQILVKVSTDYGVTYSLVKTVASVYDHSLVVDVNGYIYLMHQVSATSVMVERSIDNGANWTTQTASNYVISGMESFKMTSDNGILMVFAENGTDSAIEYSSNGGVSWSTIPSEPGSSVIGAGTNDSYALVDGDTIEYKSYPSGEQYTVYGTMYRYGYDDFYGGNTWVEKDIEHLDVNSEVIDISVQENNASLEAYNDRYAYSSFGFYSAPDHKVAVVLSNNSGTTWYVVSTPIGWNSESALFGSEVEPIKFLGCPLFCITDVPYLNHKWTFNKGDWEDKFVRQKDKFDKVDFCGCRYK